MMISIMEKIKPGKRESTEERRKIAILSKISMVMFTGKVS